MRITVLPRYMYSVCLIALLIAPRSINAEPTVPKDFYSQDYAGAPSIEQGGAAPRTSVPIRRRTPIQARTQASRNNTNTTNNTNNIRASNGPGPAALAASKKRAKIVLSLYVNSLDKQHLEQVIAVALRIMDEKRGLVIKVQHVGDYRNVSPELQAELTKRGIQLYAAGLPDESFQITTSPAWFIYTPQGERIVEGMIDIGRFIDEWGEYRAVAADEPQIIDELSKF